MGQRKGRGFCQAGQPLNGDPPDRERPISPEKQMQKAVRFEDEEEGLQRSIAPVSKGEKEGSGVKADDARETKQEPLIPMPQRTTRERTSEESRRSSSEGR